MERFFTGKKFAVVGFEEEAEAELGEWLEEAGAELVFKDFAGTLDYLVLTIERGSAAKSGYDKMTKFKIHELWSERRFC